MIGAGVAGLQAIATARRLGAQVWGYDVRPVVKEQVESLGAKFLEFDLGVADAEDKGGYAKALSADASRRQQEHAGREDEGLRRRHHHGARAGQAGAAAHHQGDRRRRCGPGSVIVDLAAESGRQLRAHASRTRWWSRTASPSTGPTNLPATMPVHASQLYARNVTELLKEFVKDGELALDFDDEVDRRARASRTRARS